MITKTQSLDSFINKSLYEKNKGYYQKKIEFGRKGDFITSPGISKLFSEMIAIWIVSFWESLNRPDKINLVELGAGNGELLEVLIKTLNKLEAVKDKFKFCIFEKSESLKKLQKKKFFKNVKWINNLSELKNFPTIFVANEFFDALPIKQFIKINNEWYENFVLLNKSGKFFLKKKKVTKKKMEKIFNQGIDENQNFIEFSPIMVKYLKSICKKIKSSTGGILLIDYGTSNKKMYDSLQGIKNHKKVNIFDDYQNIDITHHINFNFIKQIVNLNGLKVGGIINQGSFLKNMGIDLRAEMISKKMSFLKKTDLYTRIRRLTHKDEMGELFKVMFVTTKDNNFKTGFNDIKI
ncbi:MAG: SAM-dependent methyltransferase [Candidatus Pelagibacter sp.]